MTALRIKTIALAGLLVGILMPSAVFAAFDDLTLETSAILDVGGYEITVYGSSATLETLVVNANTFVVTLQDGSSIVVASADRVDFVNDALEALISSEVCSETESRLGLTNTNSGETEITVTPSGTCTVAAVEEEDSEGGGSSHRREGVEGSSNNNALIESLTQRIEELKGILAGLLNDSSAPSSSDFIYTRNLTLGDVGDDVRQLQLFLIAQNKGPRAQALATNGTTGYFGPLTQAALAEFQASVGITPAVGFFGPVTRAYVTGL